MSNDHQFVKGFSYRWGLPELMARKNIRFALDLHRRLASVGCDVSRQTVNQWVAQGDGHNVRVQHLVALCTVLECGPEELVMLIIEQQ